MNKTRTDDHRETAAARQLDHLCGTFVMDAQRTIDGGKDPFPVFSDLCEGVLEQHGLQRTDNGDLLKAAALRDLRARLHLLQTLRKPDGLQELVLGVVTAEAYRQANVDVMSIMNELFVTSPGNETAPHRAAYIATKAGQYRESWFRFFLNIDEGLRKAYAEGLIRYTRARLAGTVVL